jgi:hypothetical protein
MTNLRIMACLFTSLLYPQMMMVPMMDGAMGYDQYGNMNMNGMYGGMTDPNTGLALSSQEQINIMALQVRGERQEALLMKRGERQEALLMKQVVFV